ncbi:MAG: response regulator, partial [Acidobacteriota bacterium]
MAPESGPARLRVLIVDDEAPARTLLREYLGSDPGVEILGECANGFEAIEFLSTVKPDLLLLDIQMPRLSGFELLELVNEDIQVVFLTA